MRKFIPLFVLLVAGCAATPASQTAQLQQAVQYGTMVANSLADSVPAALATLAQSGQVSAVDVAKASAAAATLRAASAALTNAGSLDAAQPLVQQIEGAVNALVAAAASANGIPPTVRSYLLAAEAVLPLLDLAVGLAINSPPPTPAAASVAVSTLVHR